MWDVATFWNTIDIDESIHESQAVSVVIIGQSCKQCVAPPEIFKMHLLEVAEEILRHDLRPN